MNIVRKSGTKTNDNMRPLSEGEVCAMENAPPLLSIGNRIVWLSDNGPEFGYIKWLGKLPDVGSDWMAGVHFDNPVGSGTGIYNDHQLFEAPVYHASLVPVIGLLRAEDFLGGGPSSSSADNHHLVSTSKSLPSSSMAGISDLPLKPRRNKRKPGIDDKPDCILTNDLNTSGDAIDSSGTSPRTTESSKSYTDQHITLSSSTATGSATTSTYSPPPPPSVRSHNSYVNHLNHVNLFNSKSDSNSDSRIGNGNMNHEDELDIGSLVEVTIDDIPRYGVIKWIGSMNNLTDDVNHQHQLIAGIELEEECACGTDGTWNNKRYFDCGPKRGYFIRLAHCRRDSRFFSPSSPSQIPNQPSHQSHFTTSSSSSIAVNNTNNYSNLSSSSSSTSPSSSNNTNHHTNNNIDLLKVNCNSSNSNMNTDRYGKRLDSSRITCDIPPLSTHDDLKYLCGKARGIQGHHNSCYLDATLFAMFSCTTIFESLLNRPQSSSDIAEYSEVQKVLKEEIVNPLRANLYVSADRVMHLRTLLEKLTSVRGLTSEEKDPEEFLNLLLNQILKADPYLKLSSGLESYFYQLFVDKDEKLILPTVQQLFDQSFLASDFKLREIPPCLLIQMPRFGRQFKMYPRIIPSLYLDITDVLENSPRQCSICGQLAEYECKECFGQFGEGLDSIAFCQKCLDKSHAHKKRVKHKITKLTIPTEFSILKDHTQVQRIYMELFAVLCIETSHYVAFVKCGSGPDAPWCFFDSMADRNGEQDGYNIPEVTPFQNLRWWLSDEGTALLLTTKDDKLLPEMTRRLLCDAYMCMYQSPDLMMYR
ncbi:ubiquitin carboxyl-terminal hydrolase CYLD-like [Panonychus citri]|uniref:ubiquitin carboxyl-terminal hydrolase CYLD-like n=1 Tax=Panonychus citri TaxID=50023 RepID=UPI0023079B88|nr:ubiquitin carboxyl-terminal hydrolase CYLD-like [Panonychus citri]